MSAWNSRRAARMTSNPPVGTRLEAAIRKGRASWAPGPWSKEPDVHKWMEGPIYCLLMRVGQSGHLSGYLGCPCPNGERDLELVLQMTPNAEATWKPSYGSPIVKHLEEPDPVRGLVWLGWDADHMGDMTLEKYTSHVKKHGSSDFSDYVTWDQAVDRTRRCAANLNTLCALMVNGGVRFRTY